MRHDDRQLISRIRNRAVVLGFLVVLVVCFATLTVVAMTRLANTTTTQSLAYTSSARIAYSAAVSPDSVYGRSSITTGEAIFTNQVQAVDFRLSYYLETSFPTHLAGSIELVGSIQAEGITRTVFASPANAFVGNRGVIATSLAMTNYRQIVQLFDQATGLGNYQLMIEPIVHVSGTIGGRPVSTAFQQDFVFSAAESEILPPGLTTVLGAASSTASSRSVYSKSDTEVISHSAVGPSKISAGPVVIALIDARAIGAVGTFLFLVLLVMISRSISQLLRSSEQLRIALRYRPSLVRVTSMAIDEDQIIGVETIRDLGAMARKFETFIQVVEEDGCTSYFVRDGRTSYRYQIIHSTAASAIDSAVQSGIRGAEADPRGNPDAINVVEKTGGDRLFQRA